MTLEKPKRQRILPNPRKTYPGKLVMQFLKKYQKKCQNVLIKPFTNKGPFKSATTKREKENTCAMALQQAHISSSPKQWLGDDGRKFKTLMLKAMAAWRVTNAYSTNPTGHAQHQPLESISSKDLWQLRTSSPDADVRQILSQLSEDQVRMMPVDW